MHIPCTLGFQQANKAQGWRIRPVANYSVAEWTFPSAAGTKWAGRGLAPPPWSRVALAGLCPPPSEFPRRPLLGISVNKALSPARIGLQDRGEGRV